MIGLGTEKGEDFEGKGGASERVEGGWAPGEGERAWGGEGGSGPKWCPGEIPPLNPVPVCDPTHCPCPSHPNKSGEREAGDPAVSSALYPNWLRAPVVKPPLATGLPSSRAAQACRPPSPCY